MDKENYINFLVWQKMCAKENVWNLFKEFINEKANNDKSEILDKWNKIEKLLDDINAILR